MGSEQALFMLLLAGVTTGPCKYIFFLTIVGMIANEIVQNHRRKIYSQILLFPQCSLHMSVKDHLNSIFFLYL